MTRFAVVPKKIMGIVPWWLLELLQLIGALFRSRVAVNRWRRHVFSAPEGLNTPSEHVFMPREVLFRSFHHVFRSRVGL